MMITEDNRQLNNHHRDFVTALNTSQQPTFNSAASLVSTCSYPPLLFLCLAAVLSICFLLCLTQGTRSQSLSVKMKAHNNLATESALPACSILSSFVAGHVPTRRLWKLVSQAIPSYILSGKSMFVQSCWSRRDSQLMATSWLSLFPCHGRTCNFNPVLSQVYSEGQETS
jgi:hypothetical protein